MASSASEHHPADAPRPIIGLTTYMQQAQWECWDTEATILPAEYSRMVVAAGGTPVLLPPLGTDTDVLDRLDGLILTGGADIGPGRYQQERHPRTKDHPWRDAHEFPLFAAAQDKGLPTLGICRGLQLINAARGGTLHQHAPEGPAHDAHQHQPALGEFGQMSARTEPGSRIAGILGEGLSAPCHHHQSIDVLGTGLRVTARAEDGTIEAVEGGEDAPWLLAVQWHPEHDPADERVLTAFVDVARRHRHQQPLPQKQSIPHQPSPGAPA